MPENNFPNPKAIDEKEIIGRRAFGKVISNGRGREAEGSFRISLFLDTRLKENLSFDRLDNKSPPDPDKKVRKFLMPECSAHAVKKNDEFHGWAQIKIIQINHLNVVPTPSSINPYHADIDRADYREKSQAESLACCLAFLASKHSLVDPV